MKSTKGFTLVELLVVIGLLAMLMAAMTVSLSGAQKRSQIAKAESEVKVISQAILAYEQYDKNHELKAMRDVDADKSSLGFLLGDGGSAQSGGEIPVLLMGQLESGGKMLDPWGQAYKVSITPGGASVRFNSGTGQLQSGFFFPNYYRLSAEERQ